MRRVLLLLPILALFTLPFLAQEPTVAQILIDAATDAEEPQFQVLLAAALESGLFDILDDVEEEVTVFAPTDEAFISALEELDLSYSELMADTDAVIALLTYHVVSGRFFAEDVSREESLSTLLTDASINVTQSDDGLFLNETVQIIAPDMEAVNGVIHVIDGVLLPPETPEDTDQGTPTSSSSTLADVVSSREDLSVVWEALEAAGFTDALAQDNEVLTLFLPTNDALEAAEMSASDLGISVLAYHSVQGQLMLEELADFETLPSQHGDNIEIIVTDSGISLNGEATIVEADIVASNGVIHLIDRPLTLPSAIPTIEPTETGD